MREIKIRYGEQIRIIVQSSDSKKDLLSISGFIVDAQLCKFGSLYGMPESVASALQLDFRQSNLHEIIEGEVVIIDGRSLLI